MSDRLTMIGKVKGGKVVRKRGRKFYLSSEIIFFLYDTIKSTMQV